MAWTETAYAWAAGFFDGEGSSGAVADHRSPGRTQLSMSVVQAGTETEPPDTLQRFHKIVGVGAVAPRGGSGGFGTKPLWTWRAHGRNAETAFALLRPYLGKAKLDQYANAVSQRHEYEALLTDRRRFCKRGHDLHETAYPNNLKNANCRLCNRDRQAEWRMAQKGG